MGIPRFPEFIRTTGSVLASGFSIWIAENKLLDMNRAARITVVADKTTGRSWVTLCPFSARDLNTKHGDAK